MQRRHPYCLDLTPCDFFPKFKSVQKTIYFNPIDDTKINLSKVLRDISPAGSAEGKSTLWMEQEPTICKSNNKNKIR